MRTDRHHTGDEGNSEFEERVRGELHALRGPAPREGLVDDIVSGATVHRRTSIVRVSAVGLAAAAAVAVGAVAVTNGTSRVGQGHTPVPGTSTTTSTGTTSTPTSTSATTASTTSANPPYSTPKDTWGTDPSLSRAPKTDSTSDGFSPDVQPTDLEMLTSERLPRGGELPPGLRYRVLHTFSDVCSTERGSAFIAGTVGQGGSSQEKEGDYGLSCFADRPAAPGDQPMALYNFAHFQDPKDAARDMADAMDPGSSRPFAGAATQVPWVGSPVAGAKLFKVNKQGYGGPSYVAVAVFGQWAVSVEMSVQQPDAAKWAAKGVADTVVRMRAAGEVG